MSKAELLRRLNIPVVSQFMEPVWSVGRGIDRIHQELEPDIQSGIGCSEFLAPESYFTGAHRWLKHLLRGRTQYEEDYFATRRKFGENMLASPRSAAVKSH